MKNIDTYLNFLHEQQYGIQPPNPVQNPEPARATSVARLKPRVPKSNRTPVSPQERKLRSVPEDKNKITSKSYFNYMTWTSKIIKQGEIFRTNCYADNCEQYALGTGDRRICKDRCDVETCKKILAMLRISMSKCSQAQNPNLCKVRYAQLIPLYQEKLTAISRKFVKAANVQNAVKPAVG